MEFFGDDMDRASWAKHYIAVKCRIKQPSKDVKVSVKTKKGSDYDYKYATLANIDSAIMEACNQVTDKDGDPALAYFSDVKVSEDGVLASTVIIDITGYYAVSSPVWFKNFNTGDAQKTASLVTYAKRYSLSAAFGIASDDDDDARSLGHPQPQQVKRLNSTELNSYEVDYNGAPIKLVDLWDLATQDDIDAQQWMHGAHDAQTSMAIKQLSSKKKLEERIKKAHEKADAEKAKKEAEKREQEEKAQDTIAQVNQAENKKKADSSDDGDGSQQLTMGTLF